MHVAPPPSPVRRPRRRATLAMSSALLLVAAACSSGNGSSKADGDTGAATTTEAPARVLGTPNPAKGEPVKIGFVTDGQSTTVDRSDQPPAARAITKYLNEYRGGIGGRPIELVMCETQAEESKATDCANELVQKGVSMVVMPDSITALGVYNVTSKNKLPLLTFGVTDQAVLMDKETTFQLAGPFAGMSELPISIAKEEGLDQVTVVVLDVPAATAFYQTLAPAMFKDAGLKLEVVTVPPGTADLTPQMTEIADGKPTAVQIVGDESLCIATINGLRAANFDGPIGGLWTCVSDATKKALGSNIKDFVMSSLSANGDKNDPGMKLMLAIFDHYHVDLKDRWGGAGTFMTLTAMNQMLGGLTDVTPANIITAIKTAPEQELLGAGGLKYRCNGKAYSLLPAVCVRGALKVTLDAHGNLVLPYKAFGSSPIPN